MLIIIVKENLRNKPFGGGSFFGKGITFMPYFTA